MASVKLEIVGLNQLKLINRLKKSGIKIKKLEKINQKQMILLLRKSDLIRALAIVDELGFEHKLLADEGMGKKIRRSVKRAGILLGMAAAISISVLLSQRLWKIEISGNDRVDDLTIIRTLKESGVTVGAKKDFSIRTVEDALLNLKDISAVSAYLSGTALVIDVMESAVTTPVEQGDIIVSKFDAEVTRITVNSGTATVKIGDRIPMGRTLIEGVEYDTQGNVLKTVGAKGEVFGKVNFTYSDTVSLFGGYTRTGKVKKHTVFKLFGMNIGKEKPPSYKYEVERTETEIGVIVPLQAVTTKYYELAPLPELTIDELVESVKQKAVDNLIIRAGGSPVSVTATYTPLLDKIYRINVHIEAEISIGGRID